ncbi:MAG: hypothetical protein ABIR47_01725 [Candidatus Kapaibacterium sp.]
MIANKFSAIQAKQSIRQSPPIGIPALHVRLREEQEHPLQPRTYGEADAMSLRRKYLGIGHRGVYPAPFRIRLRVPRKDINRCRGYFVATFQGGKNAVAEIHRTGYFGDGTEIIRGMPATYLSD